MNTRFHFFWALALILIISINAHAYQPAEDSVQSKKKKNNSTTVVLRMHSMGFFSYFGRLVNEHPAADLYFNYTHNNKWGINVFKAVDLYDPSSGNNFMLIMGNRNFKISNKLSTNLYAGVALEQAHHLVDHGSDIVGNITTTYKFNKYFTLEHMSLLGNLVLERSHTDWVNRFKLIFSKNHVDVTAWGWHNNKVFDTRTYVSSGLSAYYARIPISSRLTLSTGATGFVMIHSSDEIKNPKKNGILLTVAATWH